ncbi:MAG: C39 family peptidase [Parvimonas micra]|nr:C39 family peptidase [Parvimonas micra]
MKVFKKVFLMFFSLLIFHLGFNSILFAENINENEKKLVYVENIFYDENGKSANGWYDDGTEWYFFKDGKKHTGFATDGNGKMYFKNGKYGTAYVDKIFYEEGKPANGWYDDGSDWYFFKNGKKYTGFATDGNGKMYFKDGKYGKGYVDKVFYGEGKPADWWYDDGTGWYFFQKGKKHTGFAKDASGEKYFVDGKYGSGIYNDILYKDGVKSEGKVYVDGIFYGEDLKPANWWYDDGTAWYFFQKGKKHTGFATDGNGKMYFKDGKYGKGYVDKVFYGEGKPADWWYDDGTGWYFFQKGKKHTGFAKDASGEKYFVDGKYANGLYNEKLYKDGIETEGEVYINGLFFDKDKKLANGWYYDGIEELYFENGSKYTGVLEGKFLVDGKYANKYYDGKYYKDGEEIEIPDSMLIEEGIKAYNFDDDKYYTGCWLYSAASGLYSKGVSITPPELLKLLPNTGDPRTGVMGNPKEHLYQGVFPACYPSALVPVLKKFVPTIEDFSGASFEDIKLQLSQGHTVQIWLSRVIPSNIINVGDGETIIASAWYHSVLLIGYNDKGFYHIEAVNQNKKVFLDFEKSLSQYEVFGRKAILYK